MTKIYLICSAEAEGDLYRFAQGHFDSNLTDRGWRQVKALERHFADLRIDKIYTSDLYRARATASAISKPRGLTAYQMTDLREICLGAWEGKNWGNIAYAESVQINNFKTALDKWYVDGSETPGQLLSRMLSAIRQIAADNDGKSVAVVSHDNAIRILLAGLQGIPPEKAHELPVVQHTAVYVINAQGDTLIPAAQNDISHLRDADYQAQEKLYNELDFDTDMYFHVLPVIEYGEFMVQAVGCVWQESGEDRPFSRNILLEDAAMLPTMIGFVAHEPAGFLQLGQEPGWITLMCTYPGCRKAGLGIQLIGQAVSDARARGVDHVSIALPKNNPYRQFYLDYGFTPRGETQEGRKIFEKDISFDPEFLSE